MGYLVLENGKLFKGELIGIKRKTMGEVVFNTGMTGYEEIITDPSYYGQIVLMTYPLIGNYGINSEDVAFSTPKLKGIIVRELCDCPSNWRSDKTLNEFLIEHNITGLQGIDTRDLTKTIRDNGSMKGIICEVVPTKEELEELFAHKVSNPVQKVSTKKRYNIKGNGKKVAVLDFGSKRNIIQSLCERDLDLTVLPENTTAEEILNGGFDGIMLTNGPGDPNDNVEIIKNLQALIGKLPIFGVGLGHQLLALAHGGNTSKLKCGHRGGNLPVKDKNTEKMYITSQNHSYVVEEKGLPENAEVNFINWNDRTVEGIVYHGEKCFSVQFYPENGAGPNDAGFLYGRFITSMNEGDK